MVIRGKERHFLLTVDARDQIAKMCPDGMIGNLGDALTKASSTDIMRKMIVAMNRGYEDNKHYFDASYEVDYLTDDDLKVLSMEEFRQIENEASDAFLEGMGISVEAEEPKNAKGKKTTAKKAKA